MKKSVFWLRFILAWVILVSFTLTTAYAHFQVSVGSGGQLSRSQLAEITPMPSAAPTLVAADTPAERQLPPVGSNVWMVLGASVLVLIIIGGVLGSRRRLKH